MLHDAGMLVLDETDRMLDMGFGIQIDTILRFMPKVRQTMLFSATLPNTILNISKKYLTNPERIEIGAVDKPALNIDHQMIRTTDSEKYPQLLKELEARTGSVIIFVKTKRGADKLSDKLSRSEHSAEAIHGDLRQSQRDRVIKAFRAQRYRILVATDVAARGLDIPHIEHVINYDLPQCPEDYIHRIGRTARAGAKGAALCFVSPEDGGKWRAVNRLLNPDAKHDDGGYDAGERRGRSNGNSNRGGFSRNKKDYAQKRPFGDRQDKPRRFSQDGDSQVAAEGQSRTFAPRKPQRNNGEFAGAAPRGDFSKKRDFEARGQGHEERADRPFVERPYRAERSERAAKPFSDRPYRAERPERDGNSFGNGGGRFDNRRSDNRRSEFSDARPPRSSAPVDGNREGVVRSDKPRSNYFRDEAHVPRAPKQASASGERDYSRPSNSGQNRYEDGKPRQRSFDRSGQSAGGQRSGTNNNRFGGSNNRSNRKDAA
jgi:superfamily II DNA/RNA helicase